MSPTPALDLHAVGLRCRTAASAEAPSGLPTPRARLTENRDAEPYPALPCPTPVLKYFPFFSGPARTQFAGSIPQFRGGRRRVPPSHTRPASPSIAPPRVAPVQAGGSVHSTGWPVRLVGPPAGPAWPRLRGPAGATCQPAPPVGPAGTLLAGATLHCYRFRPRPRRHLLGITA